VVFELEISKFLEVPVKFMFPFVVLA